MIVENQIPSSILVTGAAGFIGYHSCKALLEAGWRVQGVDNLNSYYDPRLKAARLAELQTFKEFEFRKLDIADVKAVHACFSSVQPRYVLHLAAQAGVRYSLDNPTAYTTSNIDGFLSILEACRAHPVEHLLFASSSSVYGANANAPFCETDRVDQPVSLYAATKRANELMAYTYAHLFQIPATGLRFFTVYGPWGRPDMAYYKFTQQILSGATIDLYDVERMRRDFTYVDDVIAALLRLIPLPPGPDIENDALTSAPHFRIFNIGNHTPVSLKHFVDTLEQCLDRRANVRYLPMQPGDVLATHADVTALRRLTGFEPSTDLRSGLEKFVAWYRTFHAE